MKFPLKIDFFFFGPLDFGKSCCYFHLSEDIFYFLFDFFGDPFVYFSTMLFIPQKFMFFPVFFL